MKRIQVEGQEGGEYYVECLLMGVQMGVLATRPGTTGPFGDTPYAFTEYGAHPDGSECLRHKGIVSEAMAGVYAQIQLIRETVMDVGQRDQFDAEVKAARKLAEGPRRQV